MPPDYGMVGETGLPHVSSYYYMRVDEFCFATAERKLQMRLAMHCSEFHQGLIQFNTEKCLVLPPQYRTQVYIRRTFGP